MTRRYPTMAMLGLAGACALLLSTITRASEASPVTTDPKIQRLLRPDNWIHNDQSGLRVRLPHGWYATSLMPLGEQASSILLAVPERTPGANAMFTQGVSSESPASERDAEAALRDRARTRESERLARTPSYRNRAGSFEFKRVNGQPALAWVGDFDRDGVKWSEYIVRVMGKATFGSLVVRAPADRIEALRPSADAMMDTLQLP